jgi:hypothetical protein
MQKSLLNMSPLYTTMFTGTQSSAPLAFIQPITANRAISDLYEPGEHAWIPSIGVDTGDWTEDAKQKQMHILTGAYFFHGSRMETWMSAEELRGGRWAEPELGRTPILIRRDRSPVAMLMFSHPKLGIKIVDGPDGVRFKIRVKTRGFVMELMQEASIAEMEAMAAKAIASEVEETFRRAVRKRCDPFGLLEELYRSKPDKFHEETTGSGYALSERSLAGVEVKVNLMNTGKYQGKPP